VIREVRGLDEAPPSAQVARDDARRSFGQPSSQSMSPEAVSAKFGGPEPG
jgi:hypothetical protein